MRKYMKNRNRLNRTKKYFMYIIISIIVIILLRQEIFFYVIPFIFGRHPLFLNSGDNDDFNTGFIYPLTAVDPYDDSSYAFIYYDDSEQYIYICDDSNYIKKHIRGFVIYNSNRIYDMDTGGDFILYKDGVIIEANNSYEILISTNYHTKLYRRPYSNRMKTLENIDALHEYCKTKNLEFPL